MTIAMPTHLIEAVSSAASTGIEAAGNLLHDVTHAAETAADATSGRARKLWRTSCRNLPGRSSQTGNRRKIGLAVLGAAILAALAIRRSKSGQSPSKATTSTGANTTTAHDPISPAPFAPQMNGSTVPKSAGSNLDQGSNDIASNDTKEKLESN
jgi:hypothetical protein